MAVDSGDIFFFIGAGASKPFGIPTMKELMKDVKSELKNNNILQIYENLIKKLANSNTDIDIEGILSVIQYIIDKDNQTNINDILNFHINKRDRNKHFKQYNLKELEILKSELVKYIRKKCTRSDNIDHLRNVYYDFFNTICDGIQRIPNNKSELRYDNRWTIFTTNYDLNLDMFWDKYVPKMDIFKGFNGEIFSPDHFLYTSKGEFNRDTKQCIIRLVKLHGSVSWLVEKNTNKIKETTENQDEHRSRNDSSFKDEIMMYPLLEKNLYQSPYIQIFYCLDREWENKRICLAIGYSFRDNIVRNIFRTYLKKYSDKRIILVDPIATKIASTAFNGFSKQIIPLDKKFGEGNKYHDINSSIKEKLASIV